MKATISFPYRCEIYTTAAQYGLGIWLFDFRSICKDFLPPEFENEKNWISIGIILNGD